MRIFRLWFAGAFLLGSRARRPHACLSTPPQVQLLVRAYQVRGHHKAKLDPLGILHADLSSQTPVELTLEHYGWTEKDLDKEISTGPGILPHFKAAGIAKLTIRDLINTMERIYCERKEEGRHFLREKGTLTQGGIRLQAGTSAHSICTSPTARNATGYELVSRFQSHGSTLSTRSA